jgi:hypothetical protein
MPIPPRRARDHHNLAVERRRLDDCLLSDGGERVAETAVPRDADELRGLVGRWQRFVGRLVALTRLPPTR